MTADALRTYTLKDLSQMAKRRGVPGWNTLRKEQLVKALLRTVAKPATVVLGRNRLNGRLHTNGKPLSNGKSINGKASHGKATNGKPAAKLLKKPAIANRPSKPATNGSHRVPAKPARAVAAIQPRPKPRVERDPKIIKRLEDAKSRSDRFKNLATPGRNGKPGAFTRDRLVAMVRDPFWIHAYWELTRHGVERAQAAMGQEWHLAKPVLRLMEVSGNGTTSSSEAVVRDIEIHGGVNNWYVDVKDPPKSYRLDIGYLSPSKLFVLARSNVVSTPKAGASDSIDENWTEVAENFDKIYALSGGYSQSGPNLELQELFEERLRRPMGSPMTTRYGAGANGLPSRSRHFAFELDAELIVFGTTEPDAHVTLQGDPVKVRPDGTFTVRFSLPNCRQVIPAVASSADGVEQRTVVLAIERNTKVMEPLIRDGNE